jgi:alkyl hydroperoxide reductase subunit AhpC
MPAYQADRARFAELDAQVVGISPDSVYCHIGWQRHEIDWVDYPLASDFWPHGEVAEKYGVRRLNPVPLPGISERAIFVVDKQGKIAFALVYELSALPSNSDLFEVLQQLETSAQSSGAGG